MDDETTPEIGNAVRNHFKSIEVKMGRAKHSKHRQSLVMLSRRHSTMQKLKTIPYEDYLNCPKQIKVGNKISALLNQLQMSPLFPQLRSSIAEEEEKSCQLAPVREHRITRIENDEVSGFVGNCNLNNFKNVFFPALAAVAEPSSPGGGHEGDNGSAGILSGYNVLGPLDPFFLNQIVQCIYYCVMFLFNVFGMSCVYLSFLFGKYKR